MLYNQIKRTPTRLLVSVFSYWYARLVPIKELAIFSFYFLDNLDEFLKKIEVHMQFKFKF